ncbi:MAG: hypothetical protein JWQ61_729 [Collimonas fungivorans]|nr:hypothetical protein [Collimonas fungivorans]
MVSRRPEAFFVLAAGCDTGVPRISDIHSFKYLAVIWHHLFYAIGKAGTGEKNCIKTNLSSHGPDFF